MDGQTSYTLQLDICGCCIRFWCKRGSPHTAHVPIIPMILSWKLLDDLCLEKHPRCHWSPFQFSDKQDNVSAALNTKHHGQSKSSDCKLDLIQFHFHQVKQQSIGHLSNHSGVFLSILQQPPQKAPVTHASLDFLACREKQKSEVCEQPGEEL